MDSNSMIRYFLKAFPENETAYLDHLREYGELMQHIFYSDLINFPLLELLKTDRDALLIDKYCEIIEYMWVNGNEAIKNVVDVTILEQLSDDPDVWQNFGKHISDSFKDHINNEWLKENVWLGNIATLQ